MSKTIIDKLNRLAEIAPDVCQKTVPFGGFAIGEYSFWPKEDVFVAQHRGKAVTGQPALSWLCDAIEAAIEVRGGIYEHKYFQAIEPHHRFKVIRGDAVGKAEGDSPAEALLAAFVATIESEG